MKGKQGGNKNRGITTDERGPRPKNKIHCNWLQTFEKQPSKTPARGRREGKKTGGTKKRRKKALAATSLPRKAKTEQTVNLQRKIARWLCTHGIPVTHYKKNKKKKKSSVRGERKDKSDHSNARSDQNFQPRCPGWHPLRASIL